MENIEVKNKQKKWSMLCTVLVVLAISTIITTVLLAIHLIEFIKMDDREVQLRSNLDTQVDIFSVEYQNATGEIMVQGMDGQKVVAPGTSVEYTIRLRNKDKIALDYEFVPTVAYTSEHTLPVLVRMLDTDGNYIIGDEKTWVAIHDVGEVSELGMIHKGGTTEYYFQWKWEFESGDDAYDTFLGNLTEENVGVSVKLALHAEANTDVKGNPELLKWIVTYIVLPALVLALLITAIILVILKKKRGNVGTQPPLTVLNNAEMPETDIEPVPAPEPDPEPIPVPVPAPEPIPVPAPIPTPEPIPVSAPVPTPVLIPMPEPKREGFTGKMAYINLDVLGSNFNNGDRITLRILKEKGLIHSQAKQMKILARNGSLLTKAFNVETQGISSEARKFIISAGGTVTITKG